MDNNKKQGHLGPHKLDGNNPNITIPKTNLKTQAGSTHNCIDYNLREIIEKDKIFQRDTIKEMIKNINFKQIITDIIEKEKSRQNAHINPTQDPARQNKIIGQTSINTQLNINLGPETNSHNNKKEDLESQQIETETDTIVKNTLVQKTKQDINLPIRKESYQLPQEENYIQQGNFSILSQTPPTTSQREKIIHNVKEKALFEQKIQEIYPPKLEENHHLVTQHNKGTQSISTKRSQTSISGTREYYLAKKSREKENNSRLNTEIFNAYKLSSKITPLQENEMQAKSNTIILHDKIHTQSCITQQVQSERKAAHMEGDTYQEVIYKGAFPENNVVLNNFPNSSNIENNVHEKINYLTPRKQINKADHMVDTQSWVSTQSNLKNFQQSYDKKPNPNKEFKTPPNNMADIKRQLDNLQRMKTRQTKLSFARKQQAKIMAAIKSRKRYVPYHHMASLATIGRKQPCYCTSCNYNTKQKSHFDKHNIDTSHEESLQTWDTEPKETNDKEIREITEKTYNNKRGHSNIEYYNSTINIEYPNTNDSIDTYDNDNLDIIPIQWNLTELSNSDHYESAIIKIHHRVPFQYRHNLISLLGTIYQSGTDYEIQIEIRDKFQDIGHWILSKYNRLLKNKNTRQHLQNKLRKEEYDLVSKTNDQENEVKQIAGAGRLIYDIFIHCQFIPIEYLCLLATILDNGISYQYISSSVILPYTYSTYDENIDLILNTGAFYITTKEIKNDTIINIETNKNIEDTGPQTININPKYDTQIHHMKTHTSEKDIIINDITENENIQTQLSKDDLIMQVTLQNSFNTLKEENRNTEKISQDGGFNNYRQT